MLTSQAGLTEARKIFPCLDEPSLKAQFNVVLLRKPELFSLSNMPIDYNETRSDGWIADVYKPTVKMSTYLLVFIICDFGFKQNITQNDIQFRTFSRRDSVEQLDLALNTGTQILTFFEEYFNVSFPLPKQDMIAIPDFPFGAMENWGLITFRESRLLFQAGVSSQSNKQSIVSIVTHENAHQWFGNIVSPAWWDDAWLNEGFASFIEYLGTDFLYPDWKMFEQFITTDLQQVFLFDGLATSHPLVVPVSTPDEINEAFDDISYWKGSAIIRMMRFFIGEDTFRRGLTRYLTNLKYRAATHDDLWFALANQTLAEGKYLDIKKIMDTWTLQMNYPVITVTRVGESTIRFNQTRFLVDPTSADLGKYTSPFGYQWDVPITYTHSAEQVFNKTSLDVLFLDSSQTELDHDDSTLPSSSNPNSWIIANLMEYGFYRVNYDESNWISLITQLKTNHEAIHTINRAQMINDAWNLAKSGQLSQIIALKTVEYLSKEKDYIPWKSAITELNYVDTMLAESSLYGLFSKFMVTILQDAFDAYGLNKTGSSHMGLFTQATIAGQACAYGIDGCVSVAQSMFKKWMDNPQINPIIPELKRTVYCTAIRHGTHREWDFAYNQYQNENVATEKSRILSALGCSSEVWVLSRYLSYSLDPNHVRSQDSVNVIIAVANNPLGRSLAWDYVRGNWDSIFKTFGSSLFSFARLIKGVTSSFNTEFKLSQLTAFKNAQSDLGTGNRAFEQALEKTKSNIKWMEKNEPALREWLDAQNL